MGASQMEGTQVRGLGLMGRHARRRWWQRKPKPARLYPLVETRESCRTRR